MDAVPFVRQPFKHEIFFIDRLTNFISAVDRTRSNLRRMGSGRLFTVKFDLTREVSTPAAPWGSVEKMEKKSPIKTQEEG